MRKYQSDISEDMYHRLYRLMKRDTDPRLIAAALNLPLRTVLNVISRLKKSEVTLSEVSQGKSLHKKELQNDSFLDVYFLTKTRFAILQLVGHVIKKHQDILNAELEKVFSSTWKAVAIQLSDVVSIDETGCELIISCHGKMQEHERYIALLDPSPTIEQFLIQSGIEEKIPTFGTENAFEEHAFSHSKSTSSALPKSRRSNY